MTSLKAFTYMISLSSAPRSVCETTAAFLQDLFSDCIVMCGLWPPWFPDLMPP